MDLSKQLAGAPISWGVCEANGWGFQLDPERILSEMRDCGISATELGPVPETGGILCATQAASKPLYEMWKKVIS